MPGGQWALHLVPGKPFQRTVGKWTSSVCALAKPERISIATLNYDGFLDASLLGSAAPFDDMASGRTSDTRDHQIRGTQARCTGHRLRISDDLRYGRLHMLNLHGSLSWLRDADTGEAWRFKLAELRKAEYWDALIDNRTRWRPAVILSDRKDKAVGTSPFNLTYEELLAR